jgi:hypothetical protein
MPGGSVTLDSSRNQPAVRPEAEPDREATIESLLVSGLDFYFAGDYERAIHVWTRVLFLDRTHQRARAYIERARAILAERMRRSDELLHDAQEAFERGDTTHARVLVQRAIDQGTREAHALALRERLERLDGPAPVAAAPAAAPAAAARLRPRVEPGPRHRSSWLLLLLCLAAGVAIAVAWPRIVTWATIDVDPAWPDVSAPTTLGLPVPRASDLLLARGTSLFERGHLHEALAVLDAIGVDDPRRPDAERLKADIQRVLLSGVPPPSRPARRPAGTDLAR